MTMQMQMHAEQRPNTLQKHSLTTRLMREKKSRERNKEKKEEKKNWLVRGERKRTGGMQTVKEREIEREEDQKQFAESESESEN